jgi:CDP-diacylglycerol---glycerol-3-phosphate 3-phosphatidyltransferase
LILRAIKFSPSTRYASLSASILCAATSMSTVSNIHPSINDLTKKLDSLAPRFELQSGEIKVLTTPEEFYSTLRKKILSAKKRIFLSSLYVGKEETELVQVMMQRLI